MEHEHSTCVDIRIGNDVYTVPSYEDVAGFTAVHGPNGSVTVRYATPPGVENIYVTLRPGEVTHVKGSMLMAMARDRPEL